MHRLEYSEWQSGTGKNWHCNDVKDLKGISAKWWVPARMLKMSLTDYILLLKDTFHATIEKYYFETDYLSYSFDNYQDCHKFVLWINQKARQINYMV